MKPIPRLDSHIYQDGRDVATVGLFAYNQSTQTLAFSDITSAGPFDFSKELEFQRARVFCDRVEPSSEMSFGAMQNITYMHVTCHVLGGRQ
jgi:hypothetical protein